MAELQKIAERPIVLPAYDLDDDHPANIWDVSSPIVTQIPSPYISAHASY
jgi:hypothetical protein